NVSLYNISKLVANTTEVSAHLWDCKRIASLLNAKHDDNLKHTLGPSNIPTIEQAVT
ncbi:5595_t:CDS:1, partial [Funneliformis mosseae]